jgi:hypothetical protein
MRAGTTIGMQNLVHNLRGFVYLERMTTPA